MPRDVASRNAKEVCDEGRGVGPDGQGVYLDFADAIHRLGLETFARSTATSSTFINGSRVRMRTTCRCGSIPPLHYTMGGLWVDYHLMSTIPGLFVGGEANFSDHGANRLGASALMQGLADGYFVLPYTVPDYIASTKAGSCGRFASGVHGRRGRGSRIGSRSWLASTENAAPIRSTKSSARSCGMTAAWPVPMQASKGSRPNP